MKVFRSHLLICGGTGCHASGSLTVKKALLEELEKRGLAEEVKVVETGCNGFCAQGPIMVVYPEGVIYMMIKPQDVPDLVEEHLVKGRILERLLYREPTTEAVIPTMQDIPFFALQELRVLRNRGLIDPEKIEEYIARDGYQGMAKALTQMTPEEIVQEVLASGLRGRGGAGFPTGLKWKFCASSPGDVKYVLCNADEGDPGAFMDRSVLEADPHAVLEGMVIAAKAIGSHQGYIYCRAEYPLAIHRLNIAIAQAKEMGLLGKDILGTGFDFDLEIYQGAGAFVCGEETALMTSIEGKRGMPRPRPPFPAVAGLWQKPSVLNNVETFANVGQIILKGAAWFASVGTEKSKGTKVFALTGDVNNVGLVEVPMGTTLGTIVYDIGGGIPKGKKFKAAQLGGPSGGCIPIQHLNAPVDYENVTELGAIMGSGGLIVMNEDSCAVDMARFFMDFCQDESCGKCTPCREGTKRMLEILTNITQGKGKEGDIELLEEMAGIIKEASLCGLGQTAPNPVLSTIRYFRKEYEDHIRNHRCEAAVCTALFKSPCQHTCPVEMDIPAYIALIRAGRFEDAYKVLLKTNPFPAVCGRVCDHKCQSKCRRGNMDEPLAIKYLKRFITDNAPRPAVKPVPVTRKEKIAIVGAGPAGLTAARDLALRGYKVTVFEELPEAGGMMRWAIPAYRLPRNILAQEIADVAALGVEIRCGVRVGRDIPFARLEEDYDYVYMAPGAHRSQRMEVPGEELAGVYGGVEFLRDFNMNEEDWLTGKKSLGARVAVIGGGNSAIDAARVALRLGAEVTILYRRERKDMPAAVEEIVAAEEEGIKIEYLVAPLKIEGKDGKVAGITCERMRLGEFDRSGRKKPVPVKGSEFTLSVDSVIAAIGQVPDLSFVPRESGISINKWDCFDLEAGSKSKTTAEKFYAGGDAVTGPDTVIGAIAAGHQAARDIDEAIRRAAGEPPWEEPEEEKIDIPFEIDEETTETTQAKMPELHGPERRKGFAEVELGFTREEAIKEACRCLRCDAEI
ncbi:MAG TPA: NADH-quinone oxidoreductase subunit NuoF [Syntrophales bacterium]|nr:NADH-quinone oxidoreductase subunit NuoF [Syntrophales bacterium]HPC00964.1 NADH-quinone oxidoreductase subunit NuoF [Syntrophales bacterium]HRS86857.1 NADH-quinone oxidoreductase subunit NuoF [Syntrophales bacterium]HRV42335.1 NADH-quinone oxidoreductase subunit NuoF [Syntrophales bacterium]